MMAIEEELAKLSSKMDEYHKKDMARANRDKYVQLSFILWAFALATTSFMMSTPNLGNISMAIVFYVGGVVSLFYSARFKAA